MTIPIPSQWIRPGIAVIISFLLFVTTGCSNDEPTPGYPSPRGFLYNGPCLAMQYNAFMGIQSSYHDFSDHRNIAVIQSDGPAVYPKDLIAPLDNYIFPETDSLPYPRAGLFEKLSDMNGDNGFVKGTPYYDDNSIYHNLLLQRAAIEDITGVQVTAMTDYDANHTQGSSLTEITNVTYSSTYPFIHAGYDLTPSSKGNGPHPLILEVSQEEIESTNALNIRQSDAFWWHCKATDIPDNPLKMTYCMLALSLEEAPAQEAVIEVAVTVQMRGGEYPARTYTQTYKVK